MDDWSRPVEIFATGDTLVVDDAHAESVDAVLDAVRRGGAAVRSAHATTGYRPGGVPTAPPSTSGRRTGAAEIVRPVLVDPRRASSVAADALFVEPVTGLTLERAAADRRFLVWNGLLTGVGAQPVPVALHLLASPSLVVTVLELVPQRSIRWHRRSFVRAGIAAVEIIARRLESMSLASTTAV